MLSVTSQQTSDGEWYIKTSGGVAWYKPIFVLQYLLRMDVRVFSEILIF